jgi:hypothetical protein
MGLEMLLGGADELDSGKLVAALLEAADDIAHKPTLEKVSFEMIAGWGCKELVTREKSYLDAIGLDSNKSPFRGRHDCDEERIGC